MAKLFKKIKWKWCMLFVLIIVLFLMIISNCIISKTTTESIYTSVEDIPYNKVALLLGTSKTISNGAVNYYYQYRIEAVVALYNAHKVDFIIVSGDNSRKEYDEPTDMKNDLMAAGIPENRIFLDYAGFRTLDSVVRCKAIFGQNRITIISQRFHDERAIYIARQYDIDAIGFAAKDVKEMASIKTRIRERFARVKVFLDLLVNKQPKFLGEPVVIE